MIFFYDPDSVDNIPKVLAIRQGLRLKWGDNELVICFNEETYEWSLVDPGIGMVLLNGAYSDLEEFAAELNDFSIDIGLEVIG